MTVKTELAPLEREARMKREKVKITLEVPLAKWRELREMARKMKAPHLGFIQASASWGCCVCPLDSKKCEEEKRRYAAFGGGGRVTHFDCYGALMRWLFWED